MEESTPIRRNSVNTIKTSWCFKLNVVSYPWNVCQMHAACKKTALSSRLTLISTYKTKFYEIMLSRLI